MGRSPKLALAAAVVAVVLVAGAAFAAFGAASDSGTSTQPGGVPQVQQAGNATGADRFAAQLASKLGVSQARLEAALDSVRQQQGTSQTPPSRSQMDAALAKALGVSEAKVAAAMQAVGPPGPPPGAPSSGQAPQTQSS
jgi:hypothetical protein